jgi:hypothetical protein
LALRPLCAGFQIENSYEPEKSFIFKAFQEKNGQVIGIEYGQLFKYYLNRNRELKNSKGCVRYLLSDLESDLKI